MGLQPLSRSRWLTCSRRPDNDGGQQPRPRICQPVPPLPLVAGREWIVAGRHCSRVSDHAVAVVDSQLSASILSENRVRSLDRIGLGWEVPAAAGCTGLGDLPVTVAIRGYISAVRWHRLPPRHRTCVRSTRVASDPDELTTQRRELSGQPCKVAQAS
jgi:hypothetical protein